MLRAIREIQPRYVVGENVRGLTNWNGGLVFDQAQADLESEGFEVLPFLLPACGTGAQHIRDRLWFVANAMCSRCESNIKKTTLPKEAVFQRKHLSRKTFIPLSIKRFNRKSDFDSVLFNYGLSGKLDNFTESIKSLGNAIVPQVAYQIFKAIEQTEMQLNVDKK
jgi:DNA (cytosine-5)-methyltransferase 1